MCGRAVAVTLVLAGACGRIGFDPGSPSALGPSVCDELTGTLLCEGFEGDPLLGSTQVTAPSFAVLDETRPYRGARSLHTRTTRADEQAWELGGVLGGKRSGDLYARFYVYQPAQPADAHIATLHMVENSGSYQGLVIGSTAEGVDIDDTVSGVSATSPVLLHRDGWSCWQVHVSISSTAGFIETWVDGVPAARIDATDTLPPDGYTDVHTGMFASGPAVETVDLWTDELVIATFPVACD